MYKLKITPLAQNDLEEIVKYIAVNLSNPKAATDFLNRVEKCYVNLRKNPFVYSASQDERLKNEGYRRVVIKNYILLYKVKRETDEVVIYRFFYGPRDYGNLL